MEHIEEFVWGRGNTAYKYMLAVTSGLLCAVQRILVRHQINLSRDEENGRQFWGTLVPVRAHKGDWFILKSEFSL